MATISSTGLLQLPNEILVQIAHNLSGSIKDNDAQRDLLNLAVTCKNLVEPAREALCHKLILHSSKTHILLKMLFKYPDLRDKAKSLTIETVEAHKKSLPKPILGLDDSLLHDCTHEVEALAVNEDTKAKWKAALAAPKFEFHGTLLCLLMTMLPQLEELYLDESVLLNFSLFHDIITPRQPPLPWQSWNDPPRFSLLDWESPNLSFVMGMLSPKLKVLELPNDLRLDASANGCLGDMHGISSFFPELKLLAVPVGAIDQKSCQSIIPPKLETLILTNGGRHTDYWSSLTALQHLKEDCFPNLCNISFYRRAWDRRDRSMFLDPMTMAGIGCYEYIPRFFRDQNFQPLKIPRHTWMYTHAELTKIENEQY